MSPTVAFAHVGSLGTHPLLSPLGECSMFLAPLIQSDDSYANYCIKRVKTSFMILDSGSLEVAIGTDYSEVTGNMLLEIAVAVSASEIVCPDCPGDIQSSLVYSKAFIKLWRQLPDSVRPRLMVVPHGHTVGQWLLNAEELIRMTGICTVGIPRLLAQRCGKGNPRFRISLAEQLTAVFPQISIHLLGAGKDFPNEVALLCGTSSIRSVDSTFIHRHLISGLASFTHYSPPQPLRSHKVPPRCIQHALSIRKFLTEKIKKGNPHA